MRLIIVRVLHFLLLNLSLDLLCLLLLFLELSLLNQESLLETCLDLLFQWTWLSLGISALL